MESTRIRPSASIQERARKVLEGKNYTVGCYALSELLEEIDSNRGMLRNKVYVYKWSGLILLMMVPLLSAALSTLIGIEAGEVQRLFSVNEDSLLRIKFGLGAVLTFMTIMNSIFRPSERFRTACMITIQMDHLIEDILIELEESVSIDEEFLHRVVRNYRSKLFLYQRDLISLFHPDTPGLATSSLDSGLSDSGEKPGREERAA